MSRAEKTVHFVGIKGAGMAALAQILKRRGSAVSGSDIAEYFFTDPILKRAGIRVKRGFRTGNVPKDTDIVITSGAYFQKSQVPSSKFQKNPKFKIQISKLLNPEIKEAIRRKIPIRTYPEAIAELFNNAYGIAVAGTHGKSTTTAWLGVALEKLGFDPTVAVGAEVLNWKSNARSGKLQHLQRLRPKAYGLKPFVLEADEYRDAFFRYRPEGVVVTNVDWDHPDYFKTPRAYQRAFGKFLHTIPTHGSVVACGDDNTLRKIVTSNAVSAKRKLLYGFHIHNKLRITKYALRKNGTTFRLTFGRKSLGTFTIRLFGVHNILNATAVVGACLMLGIPVPRIARALRSFIGTGRRIEFLRRTPFVVIDDFAHHPTEIRATLATLRSIFPQRRIIAFFQPHTFSRTQALLSEFARSFTDADEVFLVDTYTSAREKRGSVGAEELTAALRRNGTDATFVGSVRHATRIARSASHHATRKQKVVMVTLGAGDVWKVAQNIA